MVDKTQDIHIQGYIIILFLDCVVDILYDRIFDDYTYKISNVVIFFSGMIILLLKLKNMYLSSVI